MRLSSFGYQVDDFAIGLSLLQSYVIPVANAKIVKGGSLQPHPMPGARKRAAKRKAARTSRRYNLRHGA